MAQLRSEETEMTGEFRRDCPSSVEEGWREAPGWCCSSTKKNFYLNLDNTTPSARYKEASRAFD
jgi:hypothetical protein